MASRQIYPVLSLRVRAYVIDMIALSLLVYFAAFIVGLLGDASGIVKGAVFVGVLVLFEPLLVSLTGGTLGHHYSGLKIVNAKTGRHINIFRGIFRFLLKISCGFFSFFGMIITQQHRAIHDALSGSVVVFKDSQNAPKWRQLKTRQQYINGEKPSFKRRLLVFISYAVIVYVAFNWLSYALLSSECIFKDICSDVDGIKIIVIFATIILLLITLFVLAMKGRLYGASYK